MIGELLRDSSVSTLRETPLRTRTKIVLAIPLALITYCAIDSYLYDRAVAAKERKTYDEQLAFYGGFLKPGMMRDDAERELRKRSISFESYSVEGGKTDDFVLLERFGSPQFYCSFEDALARFEFDSESSSLRKISVYHQFKDCL